MAIDGKLHGKNAAIYINGSKVSNKSEWNLSMSREFADVTTFRDGNKVYAAGLMDISGTFSGLLDVDGDLLVSSNTGGVVTLALYAEDGTTLVATGPAFVDASITASNIDAIRCSGSFKSAGTWTLS